MTPILRLKQTYHRHSPYMLPKCMRSKPPGYFKYGAERAEVKVVIRRVLPSTKTKEGAEDLGWLRYKEGCVP